MDNTTTFKIGTILYALVIGFFGINHFVMVPRMQRMCHPSFPAE